MNFVKIVLTGGPCAGKTSALPRIRAALEPLGWQVITLQETATELIRAGIAPWNCGDRRGFQRCRLRLQLEKERAYETAGRGMPAEKVLLVCDRGMLDSLSYLPREVFAEILAELGTCEEEQRDACDGVFHLVTAAKGAEAAYAQLAEGARIESPEEAAALDDKLIAAWTGHNHLRVIDNSTDFEGKMQRLIAEILGLLGEPEPLEIERKFLIEYPDVARLEALPNCRRVDIEQRYLLRTDGTTARVRRRAVNGHEVYILTEKRHITNVRRVEVETRLTRAEYEERLREADPHACPILKARYCLTENGRYYEIDVFPAWPDKAFLEIELLDEREEFPFPEGIHVIREVTEDRRYTNFALAHSGMQIKDE